MTLANQKDPLKRFSDRVDNYLRYRPRYPVEVISFLTRHCALQPACVIGDVGSGTGFLAELFLKNGNTVFGIEPNPEMRLAGEEYLKNYPLFTSVDGAAESTTLQDGSCEFVTAGQSFHWFDIPRTQIEFRRILKPGGWVILLWNERRTDTPFLLDYENLLQEYGTDYQKVDHRNIGDDAFREFFGATHYLFHTFDHEQQTGFEALKGRLLSSSYIPMPDHPRYASMMDALDRLFRLHAVDGNVKFVYRTLLYASVLR